MQKPYELRGSITVLIDVGAKLPGLLNSYNFLKRWENERNIN